MSKRQILGPAVKAIREARGVKGSHFATACLMSHAHLCNIEAGRKPKTPIATIQRIADQLGVPVGAISYEVTVEYVTAAQINDTRSAAA
jgi:transcriptional regulator with XRE-family HTH domain